MTTTGYEHIIVITHADVAAFMAAVATLEKYADGLAGFRPLDPDTDEAITVLSRVASDIGGQVDAQ